MNKKLFITILPVVGLLLCTVWADGTITEVRPEAEKLNLTIRTTPGEQYQLQCTTNLISGVWEDLGALFLAEASTTNFLVSVGSDSCWFRAMEVAVEPEEPEGPPSPPDGPPLFPGN